jgi:hypothetical protein
MDYRLAQPSGQGRGDCYARVSNRFREIPSIDERFRQEPDGLRHWNQARHGRGTASVFCIRPREFSEESGHAYALSTVWLSLAVVSSR